MKISPWFGGLCLAMLFLMSCKKTPSVTTRPLMDELGVQNVDFQFLEARGKLTYQDDKQRLSSSVIIRMAKDSLIWMSLRPVLGIEALRALIRTDSAFVIDRLHNDFMAYDMKGLGERINFDLDFQMIQAILLGNTLPLEGGFDKPLKGEESFLVNQKVASFLIESLISRRTLKLTRLTVQDTLAQQNMQVTYSDFRPLSGSRQLLPFSGEATLDFIYEDAPKRAYFQTDIQRIDLLKDPLSFPFSVPPKK